MAIKNYINQYVAAATVVGVAGFKHSSLYNTITHIIILIFDIQHNEISIIFWWCVCVKITNYFWLVTSLKRFLKWKCLVMLVSYDSWDIYREI